MRSTYFVGAFVCIAHFAVTSTFGLPEPAVSDGKSQQPFSFFDLKLSLPNDPALETTRRKRQGGSMMDRLREEKDFSKFADFIEKESGLRDELDRDKLTLFAPTNEAIDRFEEQFRTLRKEDIKHIVKYHIIEDQEVSFDDLHDGMLLHTALKEDMLDGKQQRMKVIKSRGDVFLNMYARIEKHLELDADNGVIMGIDRVLMPPRDFEKSLNQVPALFSTTYAAIARLGMLDKLKEKTHSTFLVPDNVAWKRLGPHTVYYLFSKEGEKDLKNIMEYHCSEDLVYSTKMMREGKIELTSRHKDEKLTIEAHRRHRGDHDHKDDREEDEDSEDHHRKHKCRRGDRRRKCRRSEDDFDADRRRRGDRDEDDGDHHEESPNKYMFSVNKGEARIWFTDDVAKNGVIHVIDEVLIPRDMDLRRFQDASTMPLLSTADWDSE
ncbi:hypothetical protein HDU76_000094 [Blyttiomyces sp. JEL0837]|nr:hypothetical protein HDU76_000094 [Blyttiomyces sp. JEL0837]